MNDGYLIFGIICLFIAGYLIAKIGSASTQEKQSNKTLPLPVIGLSFIFVMIGGGLIIYHFIMGLKLPH